MNEQWPKPNNTEDETNQSKAEELLAGLESLGAEMDEESRAKAIEVLSSSQIVHMDRRELAELLGIKEDNKELAKRFSQDRVFYDKYGELLKSQLVKENQETFLGSKIKLVGHHEVKVDNETIDMADLSDPEIANLGEEKIQSIIEDIVKAKKGTAGQGMFWNALVPAEIDYVLKTERKLDDSKREQHSRELLLFYPIIRDSIGKDFLPKQAVLQTDDLEQLHILQEKMPLQEMTSIRNNNINSFITGEYGQEVIEALKIEKNKEKLRAFVAGVENLYKEHKLMIDTIGDNLFFRVSEKGDLDIKLVDYGTFKQRWEEPDEAIKKSIEFIDKLKPAFL